MSSLQTARSSSVRHHSVAAGVISGVCVRCVFGKTSLALVCIFLQLPNGKSDARNTAWGIGVLGIQSDNGVTLKS